MSCACGMDSVGACLRCGKRLCADHALRVIPRDDYHELAHALSRAGIPLAFSLPSYYYSDIYPKVPAKGLAGRLEEIRSDLRPLFRYASQRRAFVSAIHDRSSGVICIDCRLNGALEAARASLRPTAPNLLPGGSQRLRDAVTTDKLGDVMAWEEMASDAALKDALSQDLIHLAREKAERFQVPVEWEAQVNRYGYTKWIPGKVRATEEVFHVVDIKVPVNREYQDYETSPQYMNRHGQWGPIHNSNPVIVKKAGWFSNEERVFRVSWSDEPPQPQLDNILKRATELLRPAA